MAEFLPKLASGATPKRTSPARKSVSPRATRSASKSASKTVASEGVLPRWTSQEEALLRKLVSELADGKSKHWSEIAERLKTGRSAQAVSQHWKVMSVLDRTTTPTKKSRSKALPRVPLRSMLLVAGAVVVAVGAAYAAKHFDLV